MLWLQSEATRAQLGLAPYGRSPAFGVLMLFFRLENEIGTHAVLHNGLGQDVVAAAILAFLEGSKPGFYSYRRIADGIEEPKSTVYDAMELFFRDSLGGPVRYFPGKGWYARIHEEDVLRLLEDHPARQDIRVARNEPDRWDDDPVEKAAWFLGNVQGRPVKDLSRLPQDVGAALYALQGGGSPIESVNRMRLDTPGTTMSSKR